MGKLKKTKSQLNNRLTIKLSTSDNRKLGKMVSFSLPPITSCPGAQACKTYCYARKLHATPRTMYESNYLYILKKGTKAAYKELMKQFNAIGDIRWFRLHVSGDFFSEDYVDMWVRIINELRLPGVVYTRSLYRFPRIMDMDRYLKVWASITWPNKESWVTPELLRDKRVAVALTAQNEEIEEELEEFLSEAKPKRVVVFRNYPLRKTVTKRFANQLVCPAENGISKVGCDQCWYCYSELVQEKFK